LRDAEHWRQGDGVKHRTIGRTISIGHSIILGRTQRAQCNRSQEFL
jgi:hypothetical protein